MKRKVYCLMLILTLAITITACNKNEKNIKFTCDFCGDEKTGKSYTSNFEGEKLIICEECYKDINGISDDNDSDVNNSDESSEESSENTSIEVKPEIANGKASDFKTQAYDLVFKTDMTMTVDDVDKLLKSSKYELEYKKEWDGDYAVIKSVSCPKLDMDVQLYWTKIEGTDYRLDAFEKGCYLSGVGGSNVATAGSIPCLDFKTKQDVMNYIKMNNIEETSTSIYHNLSDYNKLVRKADGVFTFDSVTRFIMDKNDTIKYKTSCYETDGAKSITLYVATPLKHVTGEYSWSTSSYFSTDYTFTNLDVVYVSTLTIEFNPDGEVTTNLEICQPYNSLYYVYTNVKE